jgi:hypothetical protein
VAGLPEIDLHDVRHSYATAGRDAKIDWKALSKWIGHADVAFTTKQYVQPTGGNGIVGLLIVDSVASACDLRICLLTLGDGTCQCALLACVLRSCMARFRPAQNKFQAC